MHVFIGACVALILGQRVAVAELIDVVPAGDHVHGRAPAGDLIQRGEFARCQRGRDEAGPMREEEAKPLGVRRSGRRKQEAIRAIGEISDQHAVELAASAACAKSRT